MSANAANAARSAMFAEVAAGSGGARNGDARGKVIMTRGCDPVMAAHSVSFLPPMLGGATILPYTEDDKLFADLDAMRAGRMARADVVFFAPGACRWSAAKLPIPGGNKVSHGWGLEKYHARVREALGPDVPIVGSEREADIVPLLREALGLPK